MDAESVNEKPAIRALGSLFKLTQVFLWDDDASMEAREASCLSANNDTLAETNFLHHAAANGSNRDSTFNDCASSLEDMELTRQMNALGLPVSFSTSKKRTVMTKGKRRGTRVKPLSGHKESEEGLIEVSRVSDGEVVSPKKFHDTTNISLCCISMLGQCETSYCDVAEEVCKPHCPSDEGDSACMITRKSSAVGQEEVCKEISGVVANCGMNHDIIPGGIMSKGNMKVDLHPINLDAETSPETALQDAGLEDKQLSVYKSLEGAFMAYRDAEAENLWVDITADQQFILDSVASSQSSVVIDHGLEEEYSSCKCYAEFGDWQLFWDAFYKRNYYYNIKTHESTWYPPPGIAYLESHEDTSKPSDMNADAAEKDVIPEFSRDEIKVLDPCGLQDRIHLSEEFCYDDKLSGQSPHENLFGIEPVASNYVSVLVPPAVSCISEHLEELDGVISWSEIKKNSFEEVPLCSLSDKQDQIDSLHDKLNQFGSEEVWRSALQLTFMNSKTDELDVCEHLNKPEKVISCEGACKICGYATFRVPDADSLTTTLAKVVSKENWNDMQLEYMTSATDELDSNYEIVTSKKKKKVRRTQAKGKISYDVNKELRIEGISEEWPADIIKYWCQRYSLFSRFDDGIKMDKEGWFSVTPESIARHHASRCGSGIIVDCFTGVGGNAIQLAKRNNHVIAIDIDPLKIEYAQHNAAIYGVDDSIDFIKGDIFQVAPKLKADTVFMSPPWGGPDYAKVQTYDIRNMLKPHDGYFLFNTARGIASRIIMFLPRNVDINQLAELSLTAHPPWALEVEKNFLNGKLKAITAYFSDTSM